LEEHDALVAKLGAMRKQRVGSTFGPIPASIPYLDEMLADATSDEERGLLYSLLIGECSRARNDALYVDRLRRRARDMTTDPMSHAGLATTLALLDRQHRDEALASAYKALELAKLQGRQIRYCGVSLARVALSLDEYGPLQHALRELIEDFGQPRQEDIGYEFDFVDQIDPKRCDTELLNSYKSLA
jgi:hypothetical protein